MNDENETVERREHERFEVPQGAYVTLGPGGRVLGKIVDISESGIAFGYIDGVEPSNNSDELDIFFMGSSFSLRKVPFTTIWNVEVPNEIRYSTESMRRSGVRFKRLKRDQASELKGFIESQHVVRLAEQPSPDWIAR
jgi:hypothetical protein